MLEGVMAPFTRSSTHPSRSSIWISLRLFLSMRAAIAGDQNGSG
jgi:hypothetical protein